MKIRRTSQRRLSGHARRVGRRFLVEMMEEQVLLSTIIVNSTADTDVRDAELILREAILAANGTLDVSSLSAWEQISGAVNSGPIDPDQIRFAIPGSEARTRP